MALAAATTAVDRARDVFNGLGGPNTVAEAAASLQAAEVAWAVVTASDLPTDAALYPLASQALSSAQAVVTLANAPALPPGTPNPVRRAAGTALHDARTLRDSLGHPPACGNCCWPWPCCHWYVSLHRGTR